MPISLVARLGYEGMLFSTWSSGITILLYLIIIITAIFLGEGGCDVFSFLMRLFTVAMFVAMLMGCAVGFVVGSGDIGFFVSTSIIVGSIISIPLYFVIAFTLQIFSNWVMIFPIDTFTTVLILLILGFGASVRAGIIAGFLNPFLLLALTGTSLPALLMLLYSPLKRRNLITKYRQSEESLIKP